MKFEKDDDKRVTLQRTITQTILGNPKLLF